MTNTTTTVDWDDAQTMTTRELADVDRVEKDGAYYRPRINNHTQKVYFVRESELNEDNEQFSLDEADGL